MDRQLIRPGGGGLHDVVAIGGSAGGFEALRTLIADLPGDLPAAVLVVIHMGATSHLAQILDRTGGMRVHAAESGEKLLRGQVYVAAPDHHLLVHDSHVMLRRGPRENLARPAVDPLFRSAACTFGSRVIGIVLSGALNDGSAGLRAIKACGGITMVQDPAEAAVPDMPRNASLCVDVDHCVRMAEMGPLLSRLVREPARPSPAVPINIRIEAAIAAQELTGMAVNDRLGEPTRFTCPECHGTLWQMEDDAVLRFRCHVGHAFTGDAILDVQSEEVERMLWTMLRTHNERAALARRMAEQERASSRDRLADHLEERARGYDEDAEIVRRLLGARDRGSPDPAPHAPTP
jgi:two-component system, chemotaxis family, protein-glutamate methylesterase/glutaminase